MEITRYITVAFAFIILMHGCQRRETARVPPELPPLILLEQLRLIDQTPPDHRPVQVPSKMMQDMFKTALVKAGIRVVRPKKGDDQEWARWRRRAQKLNTPIDELIWKVNIELGILYGIQTDQGMASIADAGLVRVLARGDASIGQPGKTERSHLLLDIVKESQYEPKQQLLTASYRGHLDVIARQIAARIGRTVDVYSKPKIELIDTLKSTDQSKRLAAIQRLAELKDKTAIPALIEQLKAETDRSVKHRLIGAFAEIGDRRAAPVLIGLADTGDREMLHSILEALGVIGGDRVEDFLDILAMHDASFIREMVESARGRLKRRSAIQTPPSTSGEGTE